MGWSKDGSGLDVKRIRGKTLPQWTKFNVSGAPTRRARRSYHAGLLSNADLARCVWRRERRARRGMAT